MGVSQMKYVVIIGDGMADFPLNELHGKTPLMVAKKPYMDMMAKEGFCGKVVTIPEGLPPGSDVAGISIFGYDPSKYYTGRAPLEAYSMGIEMDENDVAFRCNLVNLQVLPDKVIMEDFSGGHITTEEASIIIEDLNKALGSDEFHFFTGVGYRHIMLWKEGIYEMRSTPPHNIMEKEISPYLPAGKGADEILSLMRNSQRVLSDHPVNRKRIMMGKLPANSIWLWGQGKRSYFPLFAEKHNMKGATVAAVDLVKGISSLIGFDTPYVEGATGYLDTDYTAKSKKALELLLDHDIVYIHIEAPDEASHNGNVKEKIKAIESIDSKIVGAIFESMKEDIRFLIVTDHATPISMRTHYACPVPFAIFDKMNKKNGCQSGYDERAGDKIFDGEGLIEFFIRGQ
jgi:2,3-bisphosphoglycerate-independent phosphoglycerate mutase